MAEPLTPDPVPAPHGTAEADPLARLLAGPTRLGRPRRRAARRLAAGGAAAVLLAGAVAVAGSASPSSAGHRTATVATRSVDQVLDAVATIEPVSQASVAFPVGGTVASVAVSPGDAVQVGQVLATLDSGALEDALGQARAALDQAELRLEQALDGEVVGDLGPGAAADAGTGSGSSGSGAVPTATGVSADARSSTSSGISYAVQPLTDGAAVVTAASAPSPSTSVAVPSAGDGPSDAEITAAQQAVLDATRVVDADLAAAQVALDSAIGVCAAVGRPDAVADATDGDDTTTTDAVDAAAVGDDGIAACRDALQAVLDAQRLVAADQVALNEAATALDALLAERAALELTAPAGPSTPTTTPGTGPGAGSADPATSGGAGGAGALAGSGGGGTGTAGGGATTAGATASAEELIARQRAVDAAAAQVAAATQAVEQAEIVSPIAGTVAAAELAVGDEVTAGSATAAIVVVGAGGFEVSTTVSVADLPDVEVGQAATVRPDGSDATVAGEVVAIGVAGTTGGTTTTYPVTIGLTGDGEGLGNGATASVAIVTDAATDALAVPTSAVTVDGDRHTVTVVDGDATETVAVEVGAVGQTWTEVTSGVEAGDEVSLADLDEPLPSAATDASGSGSTSAGGPSGAGGLPGGGTGGPPAGFTPPAGGGAPPG